MAHCFGSLFYLAFFLVLTIAVDFKQCNADVAALLTRNNITDTNGTILLSDGFDPVYHGTIRGFNIHAGEARPLTLTYDGCNRMCGKDSDLYDVDDIFQILTTWILPVLSLMSSLPYESGSRSGKKNAEAFVNWIGAPAAALTTTIWNILMISQCQKISERFQPENGSDAEKEKHKVRDALYVLSCINQYQYPRRGQPGNADDCQRDVALLRGVMLPFVRKEYISETLRRKVENMTTHLAFQLRLQRRKGVYPVFINIFWFLAAFVISIVSAFAQLGDNTTAHSLALGLLLSWVPIMVLASITDRNPVSTTRCEKLIERWLFNIDVLFEEDETTRTKTASIGSLHLPDLQKTVSNGQHSTSPLLPWTDPRASDEYVYQTQPGCQEDRRRILPDSARPDNDIELNSWNHQPTHTIKQWQRGTSTKVFKLGEFVGQGRRMRYCAVTDTVLAMINDPSRVSEDLPNSENAIFFAENLVKRPDKWYRVFAASQFIVLFGWGLAFMVSFNTPTIGLGCRTMLYTIWILLSMPISSIALRAKQEPGKWLRRLVLVPNTIAVIFLIGIMFLHALGALNNCRCKSSTFGLSSYGGYMDFENGEFYQRTYHVTIYWGTATGIGGGLLLFALAWFLVGWHFDKPLWRVDEGAEIDVVPGVDLEWLT